ncbi:hypothetical protein O0880_13380 [Janthinobacterium sp. SUN118]|uniref:hypothetical protein n=1 Tax=Janthinobacterium sp. SUN118 TaxID=3004100 RepID=UPI0025AF14E9|nr:hypothetical protein [Janthinobacterium sp. SUN118]MDN2710410.1 hypothetical protein [Janthinobacterium sp. SUN118]
MATPLTLPGICWPLQASTGHLAMTTQHITGHFRAGAGLDAIVLCDVQPAGKFRNGAARHWCRTHQCYWGTRADVDGLQATRQLRCRQHASPMGYVLYPELFDTSQFHAITVRQAATGLLQLRARAGAGGALFSRDVPALAIDCRTLPGLFHPDIVQLNITPPAAHAFAAALQAGVPLGCSDCARCGHPHLDLGDFALAPHRRHTCGHCGHDATHSPGAIVSTPLWRLREYARRAPARIAQCF